jgi:bacteriorhodopsin
VYREFDVAYRYLDWFVTTPTMLLSLIMFLKYDAERNTSLADFFNADETAIHLPIILTCNAIMLAFGLLSEIEVLSTGPSNAVGFVFLIGAFDVGYVDTGVGRALWAFTFVVWFLYGVAAYYDQRTNAIAYNCLDVVSKNLYGVFVTIYLWI